MENNELPFEIFNSQADGLTKLAKLFPSAVKDSTFDDNISLKDETLRRLKAYIIRNTDDDKKAYTVEFI